MAIAKVDIKKGKKGEAVAFCPFCEEKSIFRQKFEDAAVYKAIHSCEHLTENVVTNEARFEGEHKEEEIIHMFDEDGEPVDDIEDAAKVYKQVWKGTELLKEEWGKPAKN